MIIIEKTHIKTKNSQGDVNMKVETITLKSGSGNFLQQKHTEIYKPEHKYIFHLECSRCDYKTDVDLKSKDLYNYNQGKYINEAFPYIDPAKKRLMQDGLCSPCWNNVDIKEEEQCC